MKLILLGDIALFGRCSLNTNRNAKVYFSEVAERLKVADYVVGNLETPFSIKKKKNGAKSAYLYSDLDNVELLKLLHVNVVTLANNHIFDFGKEGYETTKRVLKENGIEFFGTEGKGLDLDILGNKLRFEGFCCFSSNPLKTVPYGDYGVNEYNVQKIDSLLSDKDSNGKICILAVHAGLEHVNYPSIDHVKAARWLASRHNIIYYGHHPHVAQGVEQQGNSLIAYSLGNFCFDDIWTSTSCDHPFVELTENNRSSFMLEIDIEENEVKRYNIIPIYVGEDRIHVGEGVTDDVIKELTDAIDKMTADEYEKMRNNVLHKRYLIRKVQRNLAWYLKRLRPRYFKLILDGRNNSKEYIRCMNY